MNLYEELSLRILVLVSEEEMGELVGMKTNAAQDAQTDTTMNFCKKTRDFRTRGF
jgi:hypothetical protein